MNKRYCSTPFRALVVPAFAVVMATAADAQAVRQVSPVIKINQAAATTPISSTPLRGQLTMLAGSGGNITVLTSREGKLLVDAGIAVSRPRIDMALSEISSAPPKYLINTHYHWDHTDGNPWLHEEGATIIATAATAKRLAQDTHVAMWDYTFPRIARDGMPTEVLTGNKTLRFGGQTVEIRLLNPSHTDTDLYVVFKEANVASLGDLFWNGVYPFIDDEHGGGIDGMIRADDAILAQLDNDVVLVPGHGPVGTKKQLQDFRDMLAGVRDKISALKKQGKSLDEIIGAKPTAPWDAVYGQFVIGPDFFTRIVYEGLK